jgi:hypothetical protein
LSQLVLPTGTKGPPLVPGLRTGTKCGTFNSEIFVQAHSPRLKACFNRDKKLFVQQWSPASSQSRTSTSSSSGTLGDWGACLGSGLDAWVACTGLRPVAGGAVRGAGGVGRGALSHLGTLFPPSILSATGSPLSFAPLSLCSHTPATLSHSSLQHRVHQACF